MQKEFTATVYIIDKQKVLLIYHRKLNKWLPPGGHIEADESPPDAARREVLEETGWEIEFVTQENIWISYQNARSFERPYLCLLEEIPAYKDKPAHQHMDFIYIAHAIKSNAHFVTEDRLQWFSLQELEQLELEVDIFEETLQVIRHLFSTFTQILLT